MVEQFVVLRYRLGERVDAQEMPSVQEIVEEKV